MSILSPRSSVVSHSAGGYANGECWRDRDGQLIQAHGGGILQHDGWFYWYGENRAGRPSGDEHAVAATVGVSCYRSNDLLHWENLGLVLAAVNDSANDLHRWSVIERPKVIYNAATQRFVMWLHLDTPDYAAARAGVAVADSPAGPFQFIRSLRPNGFMSRDQTVFVDDDGQAYHVCASDDNATMMVSLLDEQYLRPSGRYIKCFENRFMEAQAICKRGGRYFMIASGCTGWKPNAARSAVADHPLGDWREMENPCVGPHADTTFGGQSAFILPPTAPDAPHIALFDLWRPDALGTSGYIWLPIHWQDQQMVIRYQSTWPCSSADSD